MLFFHSYKNPGLVVDVVGDIRAINDSAMRATPRRTGMIILGGGEPPQETHALLHCWSSRSGACVPCCTPSVPLRTQCMAVYEALSWQLVRLRKAFSRDLSQVHWQLVAV